MTAKQQKMSLVGAVLMNVNLMVGSAAFIFPSMMTQYADSASFYGWILAGLLFFPVVWCIAEITKLFPGKGSFYSYSKNSISRTAGFISGWVYFLGYISIGALQLLSCNELIINRFDIPLLQHNMLFFNILILSLITLLSFISIHAIDRVQSYTTLFKVTPLLIGVLSLIFYFSPSKIPAITQISPIVLLPTIPMAIFGFWGFEGVCSISHLIKDNKKNTSRAVILGFLTAVTIYTLFHLSLISIMGAKALKIYGVASFVDYMRLSSPTATKALNSLVTSAIIVAQINAVFGGIVANGSMFCAMAEDKLIFFSNFLSKRIPGTLRPFGATIAHSTGVLFCMTMLARKEVLNATSNLGVLIAFFMTIISLLLIQLKKRDIKGQLLSILGLGSCALLSFWSWQSLGATVLSRLGAAAPLLIVLLLGYIMFLHTHRAKTNQTTF